MSKRPRPRFELPATVVSASLFRWAARFLWKRASRLLTGLVVLSLVQGLLPAGLALAVRELVNAAVLARELGTADSVVFWIVVALVLAATEAVSSLAHRYFRLRLQDDLNLEITGEILQHAWSLDLSFFEDPTHRDVIQRTQSNMAAQLTGLVEAAHSVMVNLLRTVSLLGVLIVIEPLVALVVPPFAFPFLYFQWRLARLRYAEQYSRTRKRRWMSYFVSQLTSEVAVPETKHLELGPLLNRRFRELLSEFRDRDRALHRKNFLGSSIAATVTIAALYAIFVRVAFGVVAGAATLGDLAIFGGAAARLRVALDALLRSLSAGGERLLFASDLRAFLDQRPAMPAATGQPPLDEGLIEVNDVTFTYPGAEEPTLRNLSLTVNPGETLAIVGENGAGKTTLVKLLARMYDPNEGSILFDGVDLREIEPARLRSRIGLVLQSFGRYEASVHDNIAYGDWRKLLDDSEAVRSVSRNAGVDELIDGLPDGYDTLLGRRFGNFTLSGGEWQKIALARALARDASLLILDEPTSNLDAASEHALFLNFKELSRGRTTILISHRFTTISMADRIAVMVDGGVGEIGSHPELMAIGGVYRTLFEMFESRTPRAE